MNGFVKKLVPHGTEEWIRALISGIIVLIPFSIRHVFPTPYNFQTGAYSDFTSISLYLSDILIVAYLFLNFRSLKSGIITTWYFIVGTWLILVLFVTQRSTSTLETYFSLRFIAILGFGLLIGYGIANNKLISWTFVILGAIQSLIASYQFWFQKSLGLYLLGESHLNPDGLGIAKIVTHGTKLIRGYGTFPHPNLLAAFLVAAISFNLYLLNKNYQKLTYLTLSVTLILNIFGLFLTFSRAGIIAGAIVCLGYGITLLFTKHLDVLKRILVPGIMGLILSLSLLWPYLSTRATISDDSVKERVFYNKVGLKIIKDKFFLGTGAGLSVLHMEQYSDEHLQPWEIQPIHNYYLITIAEWGIAGLILLAGIIGSILYLCWLTLKNLDNIWGITLSLIGSAILFLFFFDHYFYTIWPTQILLWLIMGLIIQEIQQKQA